MKLKPGKPLPPQSLFRHCDPADFDFKTTAELNELEDIPGQSRAVEAIQFATEIGVDGHNVYVLGPAGSGRHSLVRRLLEDKAASAEVPEDWCYVSNFSDPRKPRALALPPGRSQQLRTDVEHVIQDAQTAIPAAFESEDFEAQREAITEEFKDAQETAFKQIEDEAKEHDIGVVQTPTGIAFIPVRENEAVSSEDFKKLPEEEQKQFHQDIEMLTSKLQQVMRTMPKRARDMRQKMRELERDVAGLAVAGLVEELMQKYSDIPPVVEHLQNMQADIIENVGLFLQPPDAQGAPAQIQQVMESKESAAMRRYAINVLVDRSELEGAPVVFEDKPSFAELIGRIEHESEYGSLVTNFSLIRCGALHRANGGYLVIDAARLFSYPMAWDGLKRALKSGELAIRSIADDIGLISTVTLEPEPIPLKLKVIIIGERIYYYLLERYDPEFAELFKVPADFEDRMERSHENVDNLARWLASIIRKENLRHLDAGGLARLMEESARHEGDSERLSADIERLADLVREAHYWAGQSDRSEIGAADVQQAIDSRIRRSSRIRDRMQEELIRETFLVETSGSRVGQVNGLAVMQLGELAFGRPQRITASVKLGSGEVIDIEREVKLGGPLHSKGVLILSGFLGSHYVSDVPLSLSASLVFEQSYGGVDGDSASTAELCVLASALAEVPIRQSLAITGSIDQHGRVQAIGGVNEKIEGFFDICAQRGLTGEQGVIIPVANVKHLMLRKDVVAAVEAGQFQVFPVSDADEAITLLTGVNAGKKNSKGEFPRGSVNRKIRDRLLDFAKKRQAFGKARSQAEESTDAGESS
ncbi:MAG: AAA family ATPase [Xanthomonadales bacterium]|jgi:lon-related putative ATP-dependent protease|nr:AAA family ATPase [Xanthomonadales bacterium]